MTSSDGECSLRSLRISVWNIVWIRFICFWRLQEGRGKKPGYRLHVQVNGGNHVEGLKISAELHNFKAWDRASLDDRRGLVGRLANAKPGNYPHTFHIGLQLADLPLQEPICPIAPCGWYSQCHLLLPTSFWDEAGHAPPTKPPSWPGLIDPINLLGLREAGNTLK